MQNNVMDQITTRVPPYKGFFYSVGVANQPHFRTFKETRKPICPCIQFINLMTFTSSFVFDRDLIKRVLTSKK